MSTNPQDSTGNWSGTPWKLIFSKVSLDKKLTPHPLCSSNTTRFLFCALDLNATAPRPLPREVRFLLSQSNDEEAPKKLVLSAAHVPVLSEHPLGIYLLRSLLLLIPIPMYTIAESLLKWMIVEMAVVCFVYGLSVGYMVSCILCRPN